MTPTITVCIASGPNRERQRQRTLDAYRREADGAELHFLVTGTGDAHPPAPVGDFVHVTADVLEPHPGWWRAAAAAAANGQLAAPVIWSQDGEPRLNAEARDWQEAAGTSLPFYAASWAVPPALPVVVRTNYAFTLWDDPIGGGE